MDNRTRLILAQGIVEYDASLAGLSAIHAAARKMERYEGDRPAVTLPYAIASRLRLELRLLLERWWADWPEDMTELAPVIDRGDLAARAALVRAWLTVHVEELDQLLREEVNIR